MMNSVVFEYKRQKVEDKKKFWLIFISFLISGIVFVSISVIVYFLPLGGVIPLEVNLSIFGVILLVSSVIIFFSVIRPLKH